MGAPVVLITGALTGIGRAAALAFAREGNRIVVAGRHETAGQESRLSCARSALTSNSSARMCAKRTRCGA